MQVGLAGVMINTAAYGFFPASSLSAELPSCTAAECTVFGRVWRALTVNLSQEAFLTSCIQPLGLRVFLLYRLGHKYKLYHHFYHLFIVCVCYRFWRPRGGPGRRGMPEARTQHFCALLQFFIVLGGPAQ